MNGAAPVVVRDLVKTFRSRTGEVRAGRARPRRDLLRAAAFGDPNTGRLVAEAVAYVAGTALAFLCALRSLRTALR